MKYFGIYQKSKFFLNFFRKGEKLNFFPSHFFVNFAWLSAFSGYNGGCKHSLHLKKVYNVILMNLRFKKAA